MFFFKRYVVDYLIILAILVITFVSGIWLYDGLIPSLLGIVLVIFALCYIPYLIYQDYDKVKTTYIEYNKMKKEEMTKEEFIKNFTIRVTDEFGIPEIVTNFVIKKYDKLLKSN